MIARLKSPLRAFYHELKLINYTGRRKLRKSTDTNLLVVNLDSFLMNTDMGRFSFILCQYFKYCGFELIVKIDRAFVSQLAPPYKKLFLKQNHTLIRESNTGTNTVELTSASGDRKVVSFSYGYKFIGAAESEGFYMPFPLHPKFYVKQMRAEELKPLRNQRRNVLVFFSGNSDEELYVRLPVYPSSGTYEKCSLLCKRAGAGRRS